MSKVRILLEGRYPRDAVRVVQVPSTLRSEPQVLAHIESAWAQAVARLGTRLFDGPMCRLEGMTATREHLELRCSVTSYRVFLGTNLQNPWLAERFGPDVLANPIGVSCLPRTRDGKLLLGRRSDSVAYYPHRLHPIAGSMEPGAHPFDEVQRELVEELRLDPGEIERVCCIGMVEDPAIRHPELIFLANLAGNWSDQKKGQDNHEHDSLLPVPADERSVRALLERSSDLTPVAAGSLELWLRSQGWHDPAPA
jgi:8-oxo-dGTP pyrophosphatase MutT (NUDIX family)